MRQCHTLSGKLFYYEGSLADGLAVHTSDERDNPKMGTTIRIPTNTITIVKDAIRAHGEILMGASRTDPTRGSLGEILKLEHRINPNYSCYVIPLLREEGFCETRQDGRAFIVVYKGQEGRRQLPEKKSEKENPLDEENRGKEATGGNVEEQLAKLCSEFTTCVELGKQKYTGPSVYFHLKTVERFKDLGHSVSNAAKDERFCELLYATLASWGMHRMGRRGAKMPDFSVFTSSIAGLAPEIDELSHYRITTLSPEDTTHIVNKLWLLIYSDRLKGSITDSKLVANSKVLHHLLPQLVPPIDRENTGKFFGFEPIDFQGREEGIFKFIFPKMVSIAKSMKLVLDAFDYSGFNSSPTKVIDNAIIGWRELNKKSTGK